MNQIKNLKNMELQIKGNGSAGQKLPSSLQAMEEHIRRVHGIAAKGKKRNIGSKKKKDMAASFGRFYDFGSPIEMSCKGVSFSVRPQCGDLSAFDNADMADAYQVESFGASASIGATPAQPIIQPMQPQQDTQSPPQKMHPMFEPVDTLAPSSIDDEESTRVAPLPQPPVPPTQAAPQKPDESQPAVSPPVLAASTREALDRFQNDVQSMVTESKTRSEAQGTSQPDHQAESEESADKMVSANPHSIFETLGRNMQYANSFDMGTVELDRRFDTFDQQMDSVVDNGISHQAMSFSVEALEDDDVIEDLAHIDMTKKNTEHDQGSKVQAETDKKDKKKPDALPESSDMKPESKLNDIKTAGDGI
ncbi:MAG: hypothetical protein ACOCW2_00495 [Chitinivibrionales bacterium]